MTLCLCALVANKKNDIKTKNTPTVPTISQR